MAADSEEYTVPTAATRPRQDAIARLARRWAPRAPDAVTAAAALLLWRIFFPALMSADSISQYEQAVTGQINDWHPPLMAIALRLVLGAGGGLGLLMLAQCLAGAFGVTRLAATCMRFLGGGGIHPGRARWAAVGVLLVLLLPVTPLAFYLMTFWKDAWALVLLLWLLRETLEVRLEGARAGRVATVVALGAALALVRHNAVVVLPFAGLALALALPAEVGRARRALALAAPLAAYLAAQPVLREAFDVAEMHTEDAIMVLDLVGLCAEGEQVCRELPWTDRHVLRHDLLSGYRPGDIGFVYWQQGGPVDLAMARDHERLEEDYRRAIRRFPLRLAEVKLRAFAAMLDTEDTFYFFHRDIVPNPYGLTSATRFAGLRARLTALTLRAADHRVLRWLSAVHLVWLLANVAWVAGLLVWSWRTGERSHAFLACLLLVALAYYLSYLPATPVHDFRFMYPATAAVQCVTLSWLFGRGAQKPTGRAP